jgi:hypothetical protein
MALFPSSYDCTVIFLIDFPFEITQWNSLKLTTRYLGPVIYKEYSKDNGFVADFATSELKSPILL